MKPKETKVPVRLFARCAAMPDAGRLRLMLAAAVASDHQEVTLIYAPGGTRYGIKLDITEIELKAVCPEIATAEFDKRIDDDKACMIFDRKPNDAGFPLPPDAT